MSNCLLFALALWLRRIRTGRQAYIAIRRSRFGRFPHFLVLCQRRNGTYRLVSFVPVAPRMRLLPPPLFRGRVRWGD